MIYRRCKCGKSESFSSMGVQPCQGCDECGTQYAVGPELHEPRVPHEWGTKYHQNSGKPYKVCTRCYETDRESFKEASQP